MTLEKLYEIITNGKNSLSEIDLVIGLQEFTKVSFKRAADGYKKMRSQGIINDKVERWTIGQLDTLEQNEKLMYLIDTFDAIPTAIEIGIKIRNQKKMSEYDPHEIIPRVKMTKIEIRKWLSS